MTATSSNRMTRHPPRTRDHPPVTPIGVKWDADLFKPKSPLYRRMLMNHCGPMRRTHNIFELYLIGWNILWIKFDPISTERLFWHWTWAAVGYRIVYSVPTIPEAHVLLPLTYALLFFLSSFPIFSALGVQLRFPIIWTHTSVHGLFFPIPSSIFLEILLKEKKNVTIFAPDKATEFIHSFSVSHGSETYKWVSWLDKKLSLWEAASSMC